VCTGAGETKTDRQAESRAPGLVGTGYMGDDHLMGESTTQSGPAAGDDDRDDIPSVVDELTGLANERGFLEILRMEERRHARYGGSPILFLVDVRRALAQRDPSERNDLLVEVAGILADCIRDTDTLARIDDERFAILAIQAGADATSIVGRLRLHLELRRIHQCEVTLVETGSPAAAWETAVEGPAPPALRLVRPDETGV
jgi:GGDEF domain-containing protein